MRVRGLAVAAAVALTVTACGGSDDTAGGGSAEVTVWMYPVIPDQDTSIEFWDQVEADFEAEHDDIDLTIELQPWEGRDEKIATAIASGQGPDLVLLTPDQTLQYQVTGGLKPVDAAVEDSRDAYLPAALDVVTFEDELYGVPIYHTSTTTAYNTAAFEAAGITELPTTWEDVLAAAPALAANGVAVMDYSGSPEMTLNLSFYPLLWQAGGSVFTEDGSDVAFDGPEGVAALQFLLDLQELGGLPADAATKPNAVEGGPVGAGTVAMGYAMAKFEIEQMQAALGEENVVAGAPLTGEEQVSFGIPGVLALTSISDDDDAALSVAEYISSPDVAVGLNEAAGTFPARSDVEPPAGDEVVQTLNDALQYSRPGEVTPTARQVMAVLSSQLQAALQGSKSAEDALADAAQEARDLIARGG
ncbi:sugar ABC transporter substrate-binding protein [Jiangella gansuensis]|uniref:sugar ABC transporter substrate-binding protein n=1 Tax=Jiangella gansuensis TaxID=281473 RepID=UPI0004791A63|nr:sugar ABC transporter substrate-binding protein [Jiangella gansuensis]